MNTAVIPHTSWVRAGILRKRCGLSYVVLFNSAINGPLLRREIDRKVYYKAKDRPMFEIDINELIGE